MPRIPKNQVSPWLGGDELPPEQPNSVSPCTTTGPHQRYGDRGLSEDAASAHLPTYIRFKDLVAAGVIRNWPTLIRLIDEDGSPPGKMLGRNTRGWPLKEVEQWLASRPTARKIMPPTRLHVRQTP